jgi:hypothetical protein
MLPNNALERAAVIVAAPRSPWIACSPARNVHRAWPLNSVVS